MTCVSWLIVFCSLYGYDAIDVLPEHDALSGRRLVKINRSTTVALSRLGSFEEGHNYFDSRGAIDMKTHP